MNKEKIHALQFSIPQQCFNVDTIEDTLNTSLSNFFTNCNNGYITLFLSKDRKVVSEISEVLKLRSDRSKPYQKDDVDYICDFLEERQSKLIHFDISEFRSMICSL